ncbi:MAG: adenylate cyclase [Saprospiraceae bacterium]
MNKRSGIIIWAIVLSSLLAAIRFWDPIPVQAIRATVFDLYQRIEPRDVERLPVTIIDIDEKSLAEIGQWPWSRYRMAELVSKLQQLQPLAIGFDVVFAEADRYSKETVAKQLPSDQFTADKLEDYDLMFAQVIQQGPVILGEMVRHDDQAEQKPPREYPFKWHRDPKPYLPSITSRISNIDVLDQAASGAGVVSLLPEVDGVIRRVPTVFSQGKDLLPAFGVEILNVALGAENIIIDVDDAGINKVTVSGIDIPTNREGLSWVHFNPHQIARYVSAADILNGSADPELLLGHIMLIGTSASGLHDIRMTPMGVQMPGVEVWAQWLESVIFGEPLKRPNFYVVAEVLSAAIACLLLTLLIIRSSAVKSLLIYVLLSLGYVGYSWWLYTKENSLFDASFPLLVTGLLFSSLILIKFRTEEHSKKQIRHAFNHYLSPAVIDEISNDPEKLALGGEAREITSLFTDLEGFTSLSESFEPAQLVELINEYLDGICHVMIDHGGTIDKIIGDAVHVLFGAPAENKNHAQDAVRCALAVDVFTELFREQKNAQGIDLGVTRIGINTGNAVVGNFGGEARFDYTAYGDTINTAARLEGANKYLGTRICVAKSTKESCPGFLFRPIGNLIVKGKSEGIDVFQPITEASYSYPYLDRYLALYQALADQASGAAKELAELHQTYPEDGALKVHIENFERGQLGVTRTLSGK